MNNSQKGFDGFKCWNFFLFFLTMTYSAVHSYFCNICKWRCYLMLYSLGVKVIRYGCNYKKRKQLIG